eukprot:SAG31_NODE_2685_length_5256_cov_2.839442_2_plen_185_part_00
MKNLENPLKNLDAVITIQRNFRRWYGGRPKIKLRCRERLGEECYFLVLMGLIEKYDGTDRESVCRPAGLLVFGLTNLLLMLIGLASAYSIYVHLIDRPSVNSSTYILFVIMVFLVADACIGLRGALAKRIGMLRFYAFMLLILMAAETAAMLVLFDGTNEVSIRFRQVRTRPQLRGPTPAAGDR